MTFKFIDIFEIEDRYSGRKGNYYVFERGKEFSEEYEVFYILKREVKEFVRTYERSGKIKSLKNVYKSVKACQDGDFSVPIRNRKILENISLDLVKDIRRRFLGGLRI